MWNNPCYVVKRHEKKAQEHGIVELTNIFKRIILLMSLSASSLHKGMKNVIHNIFVYVDSFILH